MCIRDRAVAGQRKGVRDHAHIPLGRTDARRDVRTLRAAQQFAQARHALAQHLALVVPDEQREHGPAERVKRLVVRKRLGHTRGQQLVLAALQDVYKRQALVGQ